MIRTKVAPTPKRQKVKVKVAVRRLMVMVMDAREPSEPRSYAFDASADVEDNPAARRLFRTLGNSVEEVFEDVSVCGNSAGLVDEDRDDAEERLEELVEYLNTKCVGAYAYRPSLHRGSEFSIQKYISLVEV